MDDNKYLVPRQPRDSCSVYVFSRLMISRLSPADFQGGKSGTTFEEKIRDATAVLKQIHMLLALPHTSVLQVHAGNGAKRQ